VKTRIAAIFLIIVAVFSQDSIRPSENRRSTDKIFGHPLIMENEYEPSLPKKLYRPSNGQYFFEEILDSLDVRVVLKAGQALRVDIDPAAGTIEAILPDDELSTTCASAVAASPQWIREKLALQLPYFEERADSIAGQILAAADDLVDEVAFVAANLSPEAVLDDRFDCNLITENAQWIYIVADSLQYIELVEDSTPDNIMTTARYRCVDLSVDPPDTVWMEIPHEIYYWWIVHPVLTDEAPKKRDSGTETAQLTYGHFWREYLWSDPDPFYPYTAGGYPLLSNIMKEPRFLWCRRDTMLTGMRSFTSNDGALNALGNWTFRVVPNSPVSPRPIQPNQIAFNHGGNCGEIQDLFMAGARTALIPSPGCVDMLEDHVWNEFWDDVYLDSDDSLGWNNFMASQVNRWDYDGHTYLAPHWAGYDDQRGGGKDVSFVWDYRGDGAPFNRIECYSGACSLLVYVRDSHHDPVDGAVVHLYSDSPSGEPGYVYLGGIAVSASDGWARFSGGEDNPYYARAVSPIGEAPTSAVSEMTSSAVTGGRYTTTITLPGELPQLEGFGYPEPTDSSIYGIYIKWKVDNEVLRGENLFTSQDLTSAQTIDGGYLTTGILDACQTERWSEDSAFYAYHYLEGVSADTSLFVFPDDSIYSFILSNQQGLRNEKIAEVQILLVENPISVDERVELPKTREIKAYPNPFNSRCTIEAPGARTISIYDINGVLVRRFDIHQRSRISWDGENSSGNYAPSGVYLVKANYGDRSKCSPIVLIK